MSKEDREKADVMAMSPWMAMDWNILQQKGATHGRYTTSQEYAHFWRTGRPSMPSIIFRRRPTRPTAMMSMIYSKPHGRADQWRGG